MSPTLSLLAHHWGRAAMAQRMGEEELEREARQAAENVCRLLDRLHAEAEWSQLADNRHG